MRLNYEKNQARKSHDTLPLNSLLTFRNVLLRICESLCASGWLRRYLNNLKFKTVLLNICSKTLFIDKYITIHFFYSFSLIRVE